MTETRRIRLALVGPRCSGKTSVGRELARRLGAPFADLDEEVSRQYQGIAGGEPLPDAGVVLARTGEPAFRDLEARALRNLLARRGALVLATGGGVVERKAARDLLKRSIACVWLRVGVSELQRRLRADPASRPSLTGRDAAEEMAEIVERRAPLYEEVAEIAVDCRGMRVDEVVAEVLFRLGEGTRRGCRA